MAFENNYNYRDDYFRRHKGLFGLGIYFCSYCGKPIRRRNSHVDHIIPKSKNQYLLNRSFNTTIACPKCNLRKSDKVDFRIVQGYASKVGGAAVGTAVGGSYKVAKGAVKGAGYVAGTTIKYGSKGLLWTLQQMFKGVWLVASTILASVFKFILKRWIVVLIIALLLYKRYM